MTSLKMFLVNYFLKMKCLTLLAITFIIFSISGFVICFENTDSDRYFKEEVEDFAEYLKHKLEKQPAPKRHFDPLVTLEDSVGGNDADNFQDHSHGKKQKYPKIESFLENLAHQAPNNKEILQDPVNTASSREMASSEIISNSKKSTIGASAKKHYGVEEIVYIRRSESDLNDPIPEMIEKLVNDDPSQYPTRGIHERVPEMLSSHEIPAADDPNALSPSDSDCPITNLASYVDQTCSDGPGYEMKFHPAFSETLKRQMEDMLPEDSGQGSKCGSKRQLGPETGVEDRALCPFVMNINNHNPSRIPEDMYEAECSCQLWRRPGERKLRNCTEVKRAIPVLWLVSCKNGIKTYKQGWDEIAVACAPDNDLPSNSVDVNSSD